MSTVEQVTLRSAETVHQRPSWLKRHRSRLLIYGSFILFALFTLIPFFYVFQSSITPLDKLFQIPPTYFPAHPTLNNYERMFDSIPFKIYFRNSAIFAVGSGAASVTAAAMAAYALARIKFPASNVVYMLLILSSALPQIAVLVPMFETFQQFHLINTHQGLILLMSSLLLPFTILILVSFIMQVPVEIEEAALIDGANIVQVLTRIVLPLIMPGISTMFMINFIIGWNELLYPLVFAQRMNTKTLSVGLIELSSNSSTWTRPWDLMSAMSILMVIPVLLIVLAGQRMIIAGLSRGAVK